GVGHAGLTLRWQRGGRMLAVLVEFGRVHDVQQVLAAGQLALLAKRGADVGFATDELNLVAPSACRSHRARHRSLRCVIATHGIQRDTDHASEALFPNAAWDCWMRFARTRRPWLARRASSRLTSSASRSTRPGCYR